MAFGARCENGWRLCVRRGRTILGTRLSGDWEEFKFKSQVAAKACADELNEKYWKEFERTERNGGLPDCASAMVKTIREHLS